MEVTNWPIPGLAWHTAYLQKRCQEAEAEAAEAEAAEAAEATEAADDEPRPGRFVLDGVHSFFVFKTFRRLFFFKLPSN